MTPATDVSVTRDRVRFSFGARRRPDIQSILDTMSATLERMKEDQGWDENLVFRVNLALEETTLNTLSYGGEVDGLTPHIVITISRGRDTLTIDVTDTGRRFNPLEDTPEPAGMDEETGEIHIGGLGVHLVREMMDDLYYRYQGNTNWLRMIARRERAITKSV